MRVLDEMRMTYRTMAEANVDLSRVDEIGFTDLNRGAGHGTEGNSGLDWVEVYGNPVRR